MSGPGKVKTRRDINHEWTRRHTNQNSFIRVDWCSFVVEKPGASGKSPASVIPQMRRVAAGEGAALAENDSRQKPQMFALGVEVHFPRGRDERMPVQDDDA